MYRWLFLLLFLKYNISLSQSNNFDKVDIIDTTKLTEYLNLEYGVSFYYPKNWDTINGDKKILFRATEKYLYNKDKYRESIHFGRIGKVYNLRNFINSAASAIRWQDKRKIKIVQKGVRKNKNGVEYGLIINTSNQENFIGSKTHIYFTGTDWTYFLIFENDLAESSIYSDVYNFIIQNIKILQ